MTTATRLYHVILTGRGTEMMSVYVYAPNKPTARKIAKEAALDDHARAVPEFFRHTTYPTVSSCERAE